MWLSWKPMRTIFEPAVRWHTFRQLVCDFYIQSQTKNRVSDKKVPLFKARGSAKLLSYVWFLCWPDCASVCVLYLIDPGGDCILGVIRQLLDVPVTVWGFSGGVSVDAGHHPLHTHHLHCVRHHQGIYERQMGTLSKHTAATDSLEKDEFKFRSTVDIFLDNEVIAFLCFCTLKWLSAGATLLGYFWPAKSPKIANNK